MLKVLTHRTVHSIFVSLVCGNLVLAAENIEVRTSGTGALTIPLVQILAEAETAQGAGRDADVARLLDRVLSRVDGGEALPRAVDPGRLKLAAAVAHYRTGNPERALQIALPLAASGSKSPGAVSTDARWLAALARAASGKFKEAADEFARLAEIASYADRVSLYQAMAAQEAGQADVAIGAYHRHLERSPRNEAWAEAAMAVIALHLDQQQFDEAKRGLDVLRPALGLVDNMAALNLLSIRLGDVAMARNDPAAALAAYGTVRLREDVLAMQREKDRRLERRLERWKSGAESRAAEADAIQRLEAARARIRAAVVEIERMADHDALVLLRRGEAFQRRGNVWEAALVFARLSTQSPPAPASVIERALAGLVAACAESGRSEKALAAARRLAGEFPKGTLAAPVLMLAASKAEARGEGKAQMEFVELALQSASPPELSEPLQVMRAHALMSAGRHEDARRAADGYLGAFPEGRFAEDAGYLRAMAGLITGPAARAALEIREHLGKFPDGRFVADARYRLAAAEYSLQHYTIAEELANRWLGDFPGDHAQRGEVLSLRGDILAAQDKEEEAVASFREALGHPLADEGLGYAMDELTRLLVAHDQADEAVERWRKLAADRPDHAFAVNAAYWIGRLLGRQGRHAEAIETMAGLIRAQLAEPGRDTVERVLLELAKVAVAQSGGTRLRNATASGGSAPVKTHAPDPSTERSGAFDAAKVLLTSETRMSATARARVEFVQAEIDSLRGRTAESEQRLKRIVAGTAIEALPAGLLGRLGELLLRDGDTALAARYFSTLVERFPRSPFADFGYVGLGDLALQRGEADHALEHYRDAIDKAGATHRLREATLGRARALLALERWDEAKGEFERIASNRSWRGPATAESLFALGEMLVRRGDAESLAQAHAHFQRLYVGYRKHDAWVAKAYLRSGEVLERLGRAGDALATYRELLRDPRLKRFPETGAAQLRAERIQKLDT